MGKVSHNSSNVRGVTADKVGRNSSNHNNSQEEANTWCEIKLPNMTFLLVMTYNSHLQSSCSLRS